MDYFSIFSPPPAGAHCSAHAKPATPARDNIGIGDDFLSTPFENDVDTPPPFVPLSNDYMSLAQRHYRRSDSPDGKTHYFSPFERQLSKRSTSALKLNLPSAPQTPSEAASKHASKESTELPSKTLSDSEDHESPPVDERLTAKLEELSQTENNDGVARERGNVQCASSSNQGSEASSLPHHLPYPARGRDKRTELLTPKVITLRRASMVAANGSSYRLLSQTRSITTTVESKQLNDGVLPVSGEAHWPKSETAGAAITHTYVHKIDEDNQENDQGASAYNGQRRLSATLQVVTSRDSVYEIIWEDAITTPAVSSTRSSVSFPNAAALVTASLSTTLVRSRWSPANAAFATWSWEGSIEPCRYRKRCVPVRSKQKHCQECRERSGLDRRWEAGHRESSSETDAGDEDSPTNENSQDDSPPPEINDSLRRHVSLPGTRPIRPPHSLASRGGCFGTAISAQQRRELLGKRKLSNLPPGEEPFRSHKDSLVLAHMRIYHNKIDAKELAQAGGRKNSQLLDTKREQDAQTGTSKDDAICEIKNSPVGALVGWRKRGNRPGAVRSLSGNQVHLVGTD